MAFSATTSLLIFCLDGLCFVDSGVLKSQTMTVLMSICSLKSIKIFFIYSGAPELGACICIVVISSCWIDPFSVIY